jgi:hypothetical protein
MDANISWKQKMRSVFFEAVDNTIGELKERFSERGMKVSQK